jgi:23S rRNA (guanosine2251-2'-O)-methyltransferase
LARDTCDVIVSIPTRGRLDSLNVSVSAGVLMYEVRRQQGV